MKRVTLLRILVILGAIGLLEGLIHAGIVPRFTIIPPSEMGSALAAILASGKVKVDIAVTLTNVAVAIVASMAAGVTIGTVLQRAAALRRILDPLFATYYAIPMYAFYPLLIMVFGLGDVPQICIGFLLAVMAVIINTLNGLDRVPRVLLKAARMHRMNALRTALRIRLPYAAPYIFTGFKLAVAYSFIGVIGAEFITSSRGIGYEISFAYNNFDNRLMYGLILFVLALVLTVNMSLHAWEKRLMMRRQR